MLPQVKKLYLGFSSGSPSTISPYLEKDRKIETIRTPIPIIR